MDIAGGTVIIAIVALFIILPKTLVSFISQNVKQKREIEFEKMKYQREILELEVQKQNNQIKLLEEENRKYDRIINES